MTPVAIVVAAAAESVIPDRLDVESRPRIGSDIHEQLVRLAMAKQARRFDHRRRL